MKKYFFKHKLLLVSNVLVTIMSAIMDILLAFVFKELIDVISLGDLNKFFNVLIMSIVYTVFCFGISYSNKIVQYIYMKKTITLLKNDIFKVILNKNLKELCGENNSQYISVFNNDIPMIRSDYFETIFSLIRCGTEFLLASIFIIKINIFVALGVFIGGALIVVTPQIFNQNIRIKKKDYSDSMSLFTMEIKDIFSGIELIKSFNIEDKIFKKFMNVNNKVESNKLKYLSLNGLVLTITNISGFMLLFIAMGIGCYNVMKGSITIGLMMASVQLMNNVMNPLSGIASGINNIKTVSLIKNKIMNIINTPVVNYDDNGSISFDKNICFDGVSFSYDDKEEVLKSFSLDIKKGEKYVIVGESGSGKSTIIKLLLKYYDNFKGSISIDGNDIRNISSGSICKLISLIHQNVFMFDSSIKENITLYGNYNREEVKKAISMAGLDSFIESLPNDIDTSVGENGKTLSGGEKQRIAIARALIKQTPVLVMDEITSALDNETSYNIEKTLVDIKELTAIIITHKLSPDILKKCDKIIAMKNGRIIEVGTFDELINNNNYFKGLYSIQVA